jgi:hypothetical protein
MTGGLRDMQGVLNLVWGKLLPAMQAVALPDNDAAKRALENKLTGLMMHLPVGQTTSPLAAKISGTWYALPENDRGITALALDTTAASPALLIRTAAGELRTPIALGAWSTPGPGFANGIERFLSVPANPLVSASGAWTADDTFTVKLVLTQTPYYSTLTLKFDGQRLIFNAQHNVAFGPTKLPELTGQVSASR